MGPSVARPHTSPLLAAPSCLSLGTIACLPVQALGPPRIPQTPDLSWDRKGMGVALCGDASWSPVAHPGNSRNCLRHGNTKLGGAPGATTAGGGDAHFRGMQGAHCRGMGAPTAGGWGHPLRKDGDRPGLVAGCTQENRTLPQFLSCLFLRFGKTHFPGPSAWTLVSEPTSCWVWSREGLVGSLTGSGGWG